MCTGPANEIERRLTQKQPKSLRQFEVMANMTSSKLFSRWTSVGRRQAKIAKSSAPEYSLHDPNSALASPPYEEYQSNNLVQTLRRPATLTRTTSASSYTSIEISSWVDVNDAIGQESEEELPPYEERPQSSVMFRYSPSALSVASSTRNQTHALCPCAQCHRLR